jgi:hypothetical protein
LAEQWSVAYYFTKYSQLVDVEDKTENKVGTEKEAYEKIETENP